MANSTDLYIDANLDIRELATHIFPEIAPREAITLEVLFGSSLQYHFRAEGGRPAVFLSENFNTSYVKTDTSIYRYKLSAVRGPQVSFIRNVYDRFLQHDCFSLAYQESEGLTDFTYQPLNYSPDYSLITRTMPVDLLLWTDLTDRMLLRKLKRLTGLDLSPDIYFNASHNIGALAYVSRVNKYERQDSTSRFWETTASHFIRVFGLNDNPLYRRVERDALARRLYTSVSEDAIIPVNIFEVIACEFLPFV